MPQGIPQGLPPQAIPQQPIQPQQGFMTDVPPDQYAQQLQQGQQKQSLICPHCGGDLTHLHRRVELQGKTHEELIDMLLR